MNQEIKRGGVKTSLNFANNTTENHFHCIDNQRYNYIPVDYIKGEIVGLTINYFRNNPNLHFIPILDEEEESGDVVKYEKFKYQNIVLKLYPERTKLDKYDNWKTYPERVFISGSLHKFFNYGEHNYNQFTEECFKTSLKRLYEVFRITPENIRIIGLEYGFNICPPIPSNDILNNLMQYRKKDFSGSLDSPNAKYRECILSTFKIKVYNKGLQYNQREEILRIEIKQTNWSEYRRNHSIITLHDFILSDKSVFFHKLQSVWDEVIFYDPTSKGVEKWNKYSNIHFWRSLRSKSGSTLMRHRKRLKEINRTGLNVQTGIMNLIEESIINLQTVTNYNVGESKNCKITGVDISMQREGSKLLSHTGLKHLIKKDINLFERIKNKYLSIKWLNEDEETQIKEIAHNIRTRYSNCIRRVNQHQMELF